MGSSTLRKTLIDALAREMQWAERMIAREIGAPSDWFWRGQLDATQSIAGLCGVTEDVAKLRAKQEEAK